jgi:hypothetical protein
MASTDDARACAVFRPTDPAEGVPVLETERILLTFDPATSTEHFIREIKIAKGVKRFGFVVPVPSKPTLAKVEHDVFAGLTRQFPSVPPAPQPPAQSRGLFRGDSKSAPETAIASASVHVQATQKIGSFTAITLAATDTAALQTWLKDNGLASPPSHTQWLDHYVALGFTFVAFRFEGAADPNAELVSERIRLSFATPAPFYPYLEPAHAPAPDAPSARALLAWIVVPEVVRPVAGLVTTEPGGGALTLRHGNPWTSGLEYERSPALAAALGDVDALLPAGKLHVQTFTDRKISRDGWGDIVFVPRFVRSLSPDDRQKLASFLPVLDPSLGGRSSIVSVERPR